MTSTTTRTLRLGTRASTLATTQSRQVAETLTERLGVRVELVNVRTEGDTNRAPLATLGGTGVFVSALREALLAGEVDLADAGLDQRAQDVAGQGGGVGHER